MIGRRGARTRPHAHFFHQIQNPIHQLLSILLIDPHAYSHLHDQCRYMQLIQTVSQRCLQYRCRAVNPDKIHIQQLGIGQQSLRRLFVDSDLGQFPQKNIAGMYINAQICTSQILYDPGSHILSCGPVFITRENPIHVHVEHRDPSGNGIDSHGV